ncbi:MAG: 3-deoxy-manno-octulosonate cytidylyltransferase [Bdellovibrionales bacterium]|nr:3-deoxy-manno-octulosonate cytidylyltransferase [Bdellovibrionales bacterium]
MNASDITSDISSDISSDINGGAVNQAQRVAAIIPARMAASRFPNKPLAPILGIPLVEHVRLRVEMSTSVSTVAVATCDQEIFDVVTRNGGKAIMTSDKHLGCIDRIAEAAQSLTENIIVNVQGDEPLIRPELIDALVAPLLRDDSLVCTNLIVPIRSEDEFLSPNAPKVVLSNDSNIMYISREPIPSLKKAKTSDYQKYKQTGVIAFRSSFLQKFASWEPVEIEVIESVDMIRALVHGFPIRAVVAEATLIGVDAPSDIALVEKALTDDPLFPRYAISRTGT